MMRFTMLLLMACGGSPTARREEPVVEDDPKPSNSDQAEIPGDYVMGLSDDAGHVCECACKPGFTAETVCLMTMDGRRSSIRRSGYSDVRPPDGLGLKLYPEDTCPAFDYGRTIPFEQPTKLGWHGFEQEPDVLDACVCTCPRATETAWPCSAEKRR